MTLPTHYTLFRITFTLYIKITSKNILFIFRQRENIVSSSSFHFVYIQCVCVCAVQLWSMWPSLSTFKIRIHLLNKVHILFGNLVVHKNFITVNYDRNVCICFWAEPFRDEIGNTKMRTTKNGFTHSFSLNQCMNWSSLCECVCVFK